MPRTYGVKPARQLYQHWGVDGAIRGTLCGERAVWVLKGTQMKTGEVGITHASQPLV